MAYGKDAAKWPTKKVPEPIDDDEYEDIPEPDRFDECNYFCINLITIFLV